MNKENNRFNYRISIINENPIIKTRNYFLVTLVLLYDSSPFFLMGSKLFFWIILFVLLLLAAGFREKTLNTKIIALLGIVFFLIVLQQLFYASGFSPAAMYKPLMYFYTPFLFFTIMGIRYFKYLFNILFFIAIYTSIIYLMQSLLPPIDNFLLSAFNSVFPYTSAEWENTILIYSRPIQSGYFFMRNSGVFHEPGAYANYLMLAIILNTYFTRNPLNFKNIFLAVVLLTTYSTTGYFMLFIFMSYYFLKSIFPVLLKPLIIVPFLLLMYNIFQNTDFLGRKVQNQFETQKNFVKNNEFEQRGRFYSFAMAAKSIIKAPITGRGILAVKQSEQDEIFAGGYGFPGLFSRFGVLFGIFYMWHFYIGFSKLSKLYLMPKVFTLTAFTVINIGLLSQAYFFHTAYIMFFIIGFMLNFSDGKNIIYKSILLNNQTGTNISDAEKA